MYNLINRHKFTISSSGIDCRQYHNNSVGCCSNGKCKHTCKWCPIKIYNNPNSYGICIPYTQKCPNSNKDVYCNPMLEPAQMCPPGNIPCPQCGKETCLCPTSSHSI